MSQRHVPVPRHSGIYYSETKSGRVYEVRYRDSDGKLRFKTAGPLLKDALDFQASVRTKLNRGERVAPNRMTFAELVEEWQQNRRGKKGRPLSPSTVTSYDTIVRCHLMKPLGHRRVQSITADDIAAVVYDLKSQTTGLPLGENTRVTVFAILREIFSYAESPRRGYVSVNPCRHLEDGERPSQRKLEPRICTPDEAARILAESPQWMQPIIQTALLTGMRQGELLGLQWEDVDFARNEITVRRQLVRESHVPQETKGKNVRVIPMIPTARKLLAGQPSRFAGGFVFCREGGVPMSAKSVRGAWSTARDRAGVSRHPRELRFHDLRHTFGSVLLEEGKDITWVSQLLGHASVAVTLDTYTHVVNRPKRAEEMASRLEAYGTK